MSQSQIDVSGLHQTWYIPAILHAVMARNLIFIMTGAGKQVNLLLLLIFINYCLFPICNSAPFVLAVRRNNCVVFTFGGSRNKFEDLFLFLGGG